MGVTVAKAATWGPLSTLIGPPPNPVRLPGPDVQLDRQCALALSRTGVHPVALGIGRGRRLDVPSDEAAELEAGGATTLVLDLHLRCEPFATLGQEMAGAIFPHAAGRSFACAFLSHGPGVSGLGAHHDGAAVLLMIQFEGRRVVHLADPLKDVQDPGPGGDRSIKDFHSTSSWTLEVGECLLVPAWTPHLIVSSMASLSVTIAVKPPA